ncbi:MAG: GAF and ANTAR domain-containing protein [Nocardioidaceae bacterium]|nr:GAF and ANTAR domain-containing protein [Nocardioidaceae bacterium]
MSTEIELVGLMREVAASLRARPEGDDTLEIVTGLASEKLPGVDFASISFVAPNGSLVTLAPTDEVISQADIVQYEFDEGPCVDAVRSGVTVHTGHVGTDQRWPAYGPRAATLGLAGQMAVHIYATRSSSAALNLYSASEGAFDETTHIAELFASHAAVALGFSRSVETLKDALGTRNAIGLAIGMTMERYDLDEEHAFSFLVRVSQSSNVKLRVVAEQIIAQAGPGELPSD